MMQCDISSSSVRCEPSNTTIHYAKYSPSPSSSYVCCQYYFIVRARHLYTDKPAVRSSSARRSNAAAALPQFFASFLAFPIFPPRASSVATRHTHDDSTHTPQHQSFVVNRTVNLTSLARVYRSLFLHYSNLF